MYRRRCRRNGRECNSRIDLRNRPSDTAILNIGYEARPADADKTLQDGEIALYTEVRQNDHACRNQETIITYLSGTKEGFIEPGRVGLAYRDLAPPVTRLPDGRSFTQKSRFTNAAPARCFHQYDLYTTFFGPIVNVEIERLMFGKLDTEGLAAVRAFIGTDAVEWHRHFQAFLEYLDIQKIRTPKGLDWLKLHYPHLTQNQLMIEMQGVRTMQCTLWAEAVREVVSAEDAGVKFIISDHPVTIYNYAIPPENEVWQAYPNEPETALKASQTIYPLNRNLCLILTNLEYAKSQARRPNFEAYFRKEVQEFDDAYGCLRTDT